MTERWRVGRKVGRTIYRQVSDEPSDDDVLIGVMDSRDDADRAVLAFNLFCRIKRSHEVVQDARSREYCGKGLCADLEGHEGECST